MHLIGPNTQDIQNLLEDAAEAEAKAAHLQQLREFPIILEEAPSNFENFSVPLNSLVVLIPRMRVPDRSVGSVGRSVPNCRSFDRSLTVGRSVPNGRSVRSVR
jgi:hypothetical protein